MALGSGSETPAGTLAGECWLAVQADSAAIQTAAAAATTTLTARMLIRRAALRQGCAAVSAARGVTLFGDRVSHMGRVPKPHLPGPGCHEPYRVARGGHGAVTRNAISYL
jgi:hypothetical protein